MMMLPLFLFAFGLAMSLGADILRYDRLQHRLR